MIDIRGFGDGPVARARIMKRMTDTLARLGTKPLVARVAFFDDDGPKGGVAIRCALTVHRPGRPPVRVEHVAETLRLAFDCALLALERRLERDVDRVRQARRYPKKYFVASRLLRGTPGTTPRPRKRAGRTN